MAEERRVELPPNPKSVQKRKQQRTALFLLHCLVFTLGLVICGLGIYLGSEGTGSGTFFVNSLGICGGIIAVTAVVGFFSSHHLRVLLVYFVFLLLEALVLVVFGGVCLLNTGKVSTYLETVGGLSDETTAALVSKIKKDGDVKDLLVATGVCSLFLAMLLIRIMRVVGKLIGSERALVMLLQTMNMTLMPLGLVFMAGGLYVADSAAGSTASTDIAAVILVSIGAIVGAVSFIGCLAAATTSQRLLVVYSVCVSFVMSILLSAGIAAFVLSGEVEAWVLENWEQVRLTLPPTFGGRYDKQQFEAWLQTNLQAMGYASLILGLYCASMLISAFSLRNMFLDNEEQDAQEQNTLRRDQSVRRMIEALGGSQTVTYEDHPPSRQQTNPMIKLNVVNTNNSNKRKNLGPRKNSVSKILKRQWTKRWVHASPQERKKFQIAGIVFCVVMLIPVVLGLVLLMYDSFCVSISDHHIDFSSSVPNLFDVRTLSVRNMYEMGFIDVKVADMDDQVMIEGNISAAKKQYANDEDLTHLQDGDGLHYKLVPKPPSRVMQRDVSCQLGNIDMAVSPAALEPAKRRVVTLYAAQHINLKGSSGGGSYSYFYGLDVESIHGIVALDNFQVGEGGASLRNGDGSIEIFSSKWEECKVNLETQLGSVQLEQVELQNTMVSVSSPAGPMSFKNVVSVAGSSEILAKGKIAAVTVDNMVAQAVFMSTTSGPIIVDSISVDRSLRLATTSGMVLLGGKAAMTPNEDSIVEIETSTGDIYVKISLAKGFFGRYDLNTEGNIVVDLNSEVGCFQPDASRATGMSGSINAGGGNVPAYGGEIIITSETGDITLTCVK